MWVCWVFWLLSKNIFFSFSIPKTPTKIHFKASLCKRYWRNVGFDLLIWDKFFTYIHGFQFTLIFLLWYLSQLPLLLFLIILKALEINTQSANTSVTMYGTSYINDMFSIVTLDCTVLCFFKLSFIINSFINHIDLSVEPYVRTYINTRKTWQ